MLLINIQPRIDSMVAPSKCCQQRNLSPINKIKKIVIIYPLCPFLLVLQVENRLYCVQNTIENSFFCQKYPSNMIFCHQSYIHWIKICLMYFLKSIKNLNYFGSQFVFGHMFPPFLLAKFSFPSLLIYQFLNLLILV